MGAKYIIRFDDIAPGMAWSKFSAFEDLLKELGIRPIIGVVPKCEDKMVARIFMKQKNLACWE